MDMWQGKHFSITDPKDVRTVIYQVNNSLYAETETEYKDFRYTPNLKRPICIIDPETTEEIKPILYFDEKTNEVKGKCKLKPYKSYFAFEIREK